MSLHRLATLAAVGLFTSVAGAGDTPVVVTVGAAKLRAADIETRLRSMPPFQLRALGDNDPEIVRQVVDRFIVPEHLFARAAEERKLASRPSVRARLDDALSRALQRQVGAELRKPGAIPDEAVATYYEKHRAEFVQPERYRLWRILVKDERQAKELIASMKESGKPDRWDTLARQHSLDEATRMRHGDLGFVGPDGHTDKPQVHVDPALYSAAKAVSDGEIVGAPVVEGQHFAVIWRRGTLGAVSRPLRKEAPAIRQVLERQRLTERLKQRVAELRQKYLAEAHPELLDELELPEPAPAAAPEPTPAAPHRARPVPVPGAGALR